MAAIDKIWCDSKRDFLEFYNWCDKFKDLCYKETQKNILDYFYVTPENYDTAYSRYTDGVPITNFPFAIDKWLAKHCPVRWVRDNYDYIGEGCKRKEIALYIDRGTMEFIPK